MRRSHRRVLVPVLAIAALGACAAGLVWLLERPGPRPGASRAEQIFVARCAECHGVDGRGSWRATLFLLRPGDLTDPARTGQESEQYLVDIITHGGAPLGRPGMPAYGAVLKEGDIHELVAHLRELARAR